MEIHVTSVANTHMFKKGMCDLWTYAQYFSLLLSIKHKYQQNDKCLA